jgi:hypothetical protein
MRSPIVAPEPEGFANTHGKEKLRERREHRKDPVPWPVSATAAAAKVVHFLIDAQAYELLESYQ